MAVQLRVILEEHNIQKLTLSTGIPDTVENLLSVVTRTFQLYGEIGLLYQDKYFEYLTCDSFSVSHQLLTCTTRPLLKTSPLQMMMHPHRCLTARYQVPRTPLFSLIHVDMLHGQCHFKYRSFPQT